MAKQTFNVSFAGADSVDLVVDVIDGQIKNATWNVVGSLDLIEGIKNIQPKMTGEVAKLEVPSGTTPAQLILKKLILKIKGQWLKEESDPELCHCRKIPQAHVERAIVLGAHTVEKVRQRTSANTGCGTCLPDVQQILDAYLN